MKGPITRRRFIRIAGIAAGVSLAPATLRLGSAEAAPLLHRWSGVALGAEAQLQIYHPDAAAAAALIERSLAEIKRLENIFSLYDETSALRRLNRDGVLAAPPQELVYLLTECATLSRATGGVFDATVQPLWDLYFRHFAREDANPAGPPADAIGAAVALVGHDGVRVSAGEIRLARPGMAITLNGIAQGYITDRVAELLRANGVGHTLVEIDETRALDNHPSGRPWTVGLKDPRDQDRILEILPLDNQAIGTSGGYGTQFDAAGRFNHIFDPATGACADRYLSVTVMTPTATHADALSTALSLLPLERAKAVLGELGVAAAWFVMRDGEIVVRRG
ncbi:MAG TPA: FAD:protein FMN transferase [Stellaceae bacterium]|nr:FAD:protein FMN transferase [Stellaceae bacterium]